MKTFDLSWCAFGIFLVCLPGSTVAYRLTHPQTPVVINVIPETSPAVIVPMASSPKPSAQKPVAAKPNRDAVRIMHSIGRTMRAMETDGGAP